MFKGNWKCSKCGGAIAELPFEPRSEAGLTCRDCYFNNKNGGHANGQAAAPDADSEVDTGMSSADDMQQAPPPMDPDGGSFVSEPPPPPPDELDGAVPATPGERKKFEGEWKCAGCGNPITSLPFEPRNTENLKCIDCFKKSKG